MKGCGYDKPLDGHIMVNRFLVNWIESKALFGDDENHTAYLNDQLWSYWNRFGPGLVIYWCGYLRHLEWSTEHGILVRDAFPAEAEIVRLDPLIDAFDKGFDTDPDDDGDEWNHADISEEDLTVQDSAKDCVRM